MLKLAIFPSSSTSFANTSTFSTISIKRNIKLAMAILSPECGSSIFGDLIRLSSIFMACSFGSIKIVAWHLFILIMLSPSSLKICRTFDPTILNDSLISCLVLDDGCDTFEINYLTCIIRTIILEGVLVIWKLYNCVSIETCQYHFQNNSYDCH